MNGFSISETSSIAIHSMVILSNREEVIKVKEIAQIICCSEKHLAKIMQKMVKAGLVESERGPNGGFKLARRKEDISLLDIYEAIEGKLKKKTCHMKCSICPFKKCIFDGVFEEVSSILLEFFQNRYLKDFTDYFNFI